MSEFARATNFAKSVTQDFSCKYKGNPCYDRFGLLRVTRTITCCHFRYPISRNMTLRLSSNFFKNFIILAGTLLLCIAVFSLTPTRYNPAIIGILFLLLFLTPRASLKIKTSNNTVTFSDVIIFVAFVFYSWPLAVCMAAAETAVNAFYAKRQNSTVAPWFTLFNSSFAAFTTAVAALFHSIAVSLLGLPSTISDTRDLVIILGLFALFQFLVSSGIASFYRWLKSDIPIIQTWKQEYVSTSLSQFTGAGLAAVIFKIVGYADPVVIAISVLGVSLLYWSYRQAVKEINEAIEQAEEAERQKAEVERLRRAEAEEFADQLRMSLAKEETANRRLRKSERDAHRASLMDALTGLPNRKQFNELLRETIAEYKLNRLSEFQLMFIDLRSFKDINDTLGHTIGDKVLQIAAKRFARMLDSEDVVARIGGDEFAIIMRGPNGDGSAVMKVARRIFQNISQPFSLSGNNISVSVNIGIAASDEEYETPEEILRDADIAMHFAKEKGSGIALFTKDLRSRFLERVRLETDLRHAIDRGELSLDYQPIISLNDGRLIGFEALLRWQHSELGQIAPSKFIPIAEDSGLIRPITVWILETTTLQLSRWQRIAPEYSNLIVSVNISGKHLTDFDLVDDVENALSLSSIKPDTLKLEITESVAMVNPEHTINLLNRLKKTGVQLSIDDFGTGYSSLSYLHRLPFDTMKIDRSFVYTVGDNGENSEILRTVILLAKNLRMRVVAEGIETESQLALLQQLGCDYGQGFLIAKPKGKEETEKLLYLRPDWLPRQSSIEFDSLSATITEDRLPIF